MSYIFIFLYDFFKKHKKILVLFLLIILSVSIYYVSQIKLEEDISKTTSLSNETLNLVLKQSKFANKLILNISLSDTNTIEGTDKLLSFSNILFDSLNTPVFKKYISDITFKISDSTMSEMIALFFSKLPVFLNENDYKKIDSLISVPAIVESLNKNYNSLISPSGFALKQFIMQDPVGIVSLAFMKLRQLQLEDNYEIIDGCIFSKDKKNLLLFINPKYSTTQTAENTIFLKILGNTIQSISAKTNNTVNADYFGGIAVATENASQIKKDVILTVLISMFLILVFIAWFFKRFSIPFISFLPAIFGGLMALAIIFIIKKNVSVISLAIGSVLLGIIVDYSLYLFTLYRTKGSFIKVLKDMSITIALCSITSATAFFSLLFLKSEVLQDLGLFTGLSILGAAIFSLILLPHTISSKETLSDNANRLTFIDKISNYSFESNRFLVLIIIVLSIMFMFTLKQVEFETDMYKMNFVSKKLQNAEIHLNKINKSSLKSIYLVSSGKTLNEALANDFKVSGVLENFKNTNKIQQYSSISSILINDSIQNCRILKWNNYWTKNKKEELKNNLIIFGRTNGFSDDAFTEFYSLLDTRFEPINSIVSDKIKALFLSDRIIETKNKTMVVSLIKADDENRKIVLSAFPKTGKSIAFDKQEITNGFIQTIKTDFELLVKLCLIFVTLVLILSFGRIELGVIAALPMFISWSWTLGIMGILGLKFNIFNIIISTFVFGLGVDYSILMIQGLIQEYKYGQRELHSYKTSIFLSGFTTIVGVGVLIIAKHPALNSMALISIIGLSSVVIISYTIEPILFKFLTTSKEKKRKLPVSFINIMFTIIAFAIFFTGCLTMNLILPLILLIPTRKKNKKMIMHYVMMMFCKFEIYAMFNVKKRIINKSDETFKNPSIIIANHQSHIDLLYILMLYPKIIVITNNWVWNNPIYKFVIRYLDFYNINEGYENLIDRLKVRIEEGYSILLFPEGSRSEDTKIMRFHKGAFLLAEKLDLDITPIIIHGLGDCMTKGENYLKNGSITMKIYNRITLDDLNYGYGYSERKTSILKFFRSEYAKIIEEYNTPAYYKSKLIKNYIFKGPFLEWYLRVKIKLENNYELFNRIVPKQADIIDIGCGYGFLSYMLHFVSEKRTITGIDYDDNKIAVANNCISKNEKVNFITSDAIEYSYTHKDVFIINDVLHYLTEAKQEKLIIACIHNLNPKGIIIIRDADSNLKKRHLGTLYTEFFSTKFGFNKMGEEKLSFTSSIKINEIAKMNNMHIEIIDETKLTSNIIYILKKNV